MEVKIHPMKLPPESKPSAAKLKSCCLKQLKSPALHVLVLESCEYWVPMYGSLSKHPDVAGVACGCHLPPGPAHTCNLAVSWRSYGAPCAVADQSHKCRLGQLSWSMLTGLFCTCNQAVRVSEFLSVAGHAGTTTLTPDHVRFIARTGYGMTGLPEDVLIVGKCNDLGSFTGFVLNPRTVMCAHLPLLLWEQSDQSIMP